ncbi:hypothetical protein B0T26DRAFT_70938 [Lasiosphaeria miniovina]|uniref:Secreted protein n=1 Tax=Lasiosphaeria miniovina TaxID=1954250 RepID=A0AA40EAJ0_9PEZI|nr:uncharacterized protein B0T26DRAFT_70938 [Lasiosphaeria miniovina]KAK0734449.1 hypothetical protein B0T26DRAFT_70938 [Lasiosphaeria miniovina]
MRPCLQNIFVQRLLVVYILLACPTPLDGREEGDTHTIPTGTGRLVNRASLSLPRGGSERQLRDHPFGPGAGCRAVLWGAIPSVPFFLFSVPDSLLSGLVDLGPARWCIACHANATSVKGLKRSQFTFNREQNWSPSTVPSRLKKRTNLLLSWR